MKAFLRQFNRSITFTAAFIFITFVPLKSFAREVFDLTFGVNGTATIDLASASQSVSAMHFSVQPDGKAVVVGSVSLGSQTEPFILRLNVDGTLDTSFGNAGIIIHTLGTVYSAVSIQADGKIVCVGTVGSDFLIVRYNADGSNDTSFGTNGTTVIDFQGNNYSSCLAVQTNGKILVGGGTSAINYITVFRLNANGSLDVSFAANGFYHIPQTPGGSSNGFTFKKYSCRQ